MSDQNDKIFSKRKYYKKKIQKEEDNITQGNDSINQKDKNEIFIDYYSDVKQNNEKGQNNKENEKQNNKNSFNEQPLAIEGIDLTANNDELTESLQNLLLDKDFSAPVTVKKENRIITDFNYVGFQNSYGENACYVNVILHLIFNINELYDYLYNLYQIDDSKKDIENNKSNEKNENNNNQNYKFLVLLSKKLNEYKCVLGNENKDKNNSKKKQVTILKTLTLRKVLENISNNIFPLNAIADPVELLTFILDILNEYLKDDLHKAFYLELVDEFSCERKGNCQKSIKNKYDKDNFIYHIYIDEIIKFIEQGNIKVNKYKSKLFEYSYKLFLSENIKKCENCKMEMNHNLVCMNAPEYLLINCVWKESNPIVDDVISFLFLIPLKDKLDNLFVVRNKNKKISYYLFGFILYSFTLSHYIICIYNYDKEVFVLFDDEVIKEYSNLYELIIDITVNLLKINGKAFFYPVMLIFSKEELYKNNFIKFNTLNEGDYTDIIKRCNEAIYDCQMNNNNEEDVKMTNYQDLIEKQKEIENSIKKKEKNKNKDINNNKWEKYENKFELNEKQINDIIDDIIKEKDINENKNNNKRKNNKENKKKNEKMDEDDEKVIEKEVTKIDNDKYIEIKDKEKKYNEINEEEEEKKNQKEKNRNKYRYYENNINKKINEKNNKDNDENYKNKIKNGLNEINKSKIYSILKDINSKNKNNYLNNQNNSDNEESEYKNKENKNKKSRISMSCRNNDNETNRDSEINEIKTYKRRTKEIPINQYNDNKNDNESRSTKKRKNLYKNTDANNIIWNNSKNKNESITKNDEKIKDNKNFYEENDLKDKYENSKIFKNENEYVANKKYNKNIGDLTPKKERNNRKFFRKEYNDEENDTNKYNKTEKKNYTFNQKFIGKKVVNPNFEGNQEDYNINNINYYRNNNKEDNDNKNNVYKSNIKRSIRRSYLSNSKQ